MFTAQDLQGTKRTLPAGTPLIFQGEVPRSGYFIQRGVIKMYTLRDDGSEQIVGFYNNEDFLPLPWLLDNVTTAMFYYETIESTTLVSFSKDIFNKTLLKNEHIKQHVFNMLNRDQAILLLRITALGQARASEKIAFTLFYMIKKFGDNERSDTVVINIKLTHSVIANLVGLTRETTAAEIHKLKVLGILAYSKKIYTINRAKLIQYMGEDSFSTLKSKQE